MPKKDEHSPERWERIKSELQDFANGEGLKRIADKHGINVNSVRSDMHTYRKRYQLKTTLQAVAHALRTGTIK